MFSRLADLFPLSPEIVTVALLVSVATFLGTLVAVPWVLTRIPQDYFSADKPPPSHFKNEHPAVSLALFITRNTLGAMLLFLGIVMLVLPGQGILTLVAASFLLQFPRKYRMQRWLVRKPAVKNSINWLRAKFDTPPLYFGD